jgi:hypothetical protein
MVVGVVIAFPRRSLSCIGPAGSRSACQRTTAITSGGSVIHADAIANQASVAPEMATWCCLEMRSSLPSCL